MTFSDQLFTVIDRNVDAMIQAHELTHLDRSTAFNLLDSPDFIGLDTWDVLEYGQHWLHPAVMPIAERIPRSAWSLWYFRDWFCDLAFGGLPHGPETHTTVLGGGINLHHESGRFFYGEEWQGREADILPSLELRAEFLFRTERREDTTKMVSTFSAPKQNSSEYNSTSPATCTAKQTDTTQKATTAIREWD
jgi:hypothetical protein